MKSTTSLVMAPVLKTYQGKKPGLKLKVPPTSEFREEDSFDRLFGARRSPKHIFSSSSEATKSRSNLDTPSLGEPDSLKYSPSKPKFFQRTAKSSQKRGHCSRVSNHQSVKTKKPERYISLLSSTYLEDICQYSNLFKVPKRTGKIHLPLSTSTPIRSRSRKPHRLALRPESDSPLPESVSNLGQPTKIPDKFGNITPVSENRPPDPISLTDGLIAKFRGFGLADESSRMNSDTGEDSSLINVEEKEPSQAGENPVSEDEPPSALESPSLRNNSVPESGEFSEPPSTLAVPFDTTEELQKDSEPVKLSPCSAESEPRSDQSSDFLGFSSMKPPSEMLKDYTQSRTSPVDTAHPVPISPVRDPDQRRSRESAKSKLSSVSVSTRSSVHSRTYATCDEISVSSDSSVLSDSSESSSRLGDDVSRHSFNEKDEEDEYCDTMLDKPSIPSQIALYSMFEPRSLEPLQENIEETVNEEIEDESSSVSSKSSPAETPDSISNRTPNMRRKASRHSEERSPTGRSSIVRALIIPDLNRVIEESDNESVSSDQLPDMPLEHLVLPPGKKYRRSLSIIRNIDEPIPPNVEKGRNYEHCVEEVLRLQSSYCAAGDASVLTTPVQSLRQTLSVRRSSWMKQITPPPRRRSTFHMSDRISLYETPGTTFSRTPNRRDSIAHLLASRRSRDIVTSIRRSSLRSPLDSTLGSCASFRQEVSPAERTRVSPVSSSSASPSFSSPADSATDEDLIFLLCDQTELLKFSDVLKEECYEGGCKLGEGVFGEVFSIKRGDHTTVLKIMPIECDTLVNGEKQKTYGEICPEIFIAKELHDLRLGDQDNYLMTGGFAEMISTSVVKGRYPKQLLQFWKQYDTKKGSDNDNPKIFGDDQIFVILEQGHGGKDLETYSFCTAKAAISVFKQIVFALAVAECALEFEHRDLHWGNVLIARTGERKVNYILKGVNYQLETQGVKATIIDYTLSRIKFNEAPIYNDLAKDPELFIGTGDYQFDVYRSMKKDVCNEWHRFAPKTNVRWLHYLLDKMLKKGRYQRKTAKVHKESIRVLEDIESWLEGCDSAYTTALRLKETR